MAETTNALTQRKMAKTAGYSLLLMAITAGFTIGYVMNGLIIPGDAAATYHHIKIAESLFRLGIFGWIIILVLDVIVAWSLYEFFKQLNQHISLLTSWFRLIYAGILAVAIANLICVIVLVSGSEHLSSFDSEQLNELTLFFINAFDVIWSVGLIVFGLHLIGLASLMLKSVAIPKVFGILMLIAGIGYVSLHILKLLLPDLLDKIALVETILGIPMAIAEVGFAFWLIIKGGEMEVK